jgi:hypothetical protein
VNPGDTLNSPGAGIAGGQCRSNHMRLLDLCLTGATVTNKMSLTDCLNKLERD